MNGFTGKREFPLLPAHVVVERRLGGHSCFTCQWHLIGDGLNCSNPSTPTGPVPDDRICAFYVAKPRHTPWGPA